MNKLVTWMEKWIPYAWACMVVFIITGLCVGASIWVIQWICNLLGVC